MGGGRGNATAASAASSIPAIAWLWLGSARRLTALSSQRWRRSSSPSASAIKLEGKGYSPRRSRPRAICPVAKPRGRPPEQLDGQLQFGPVRRPVFEVDTEQVIRADVEQSQQGQRENAPWC